MKGGEAEAGPAPTAPARGSWEALPVKHDRRALRDAVCRAIAGPPVILAALPLVLPPYSRSAGISGNCARGLIVSVCR